MATVQDLIDNPELKRIHLVEIDAFNTNTSAEETLRFSDDAFNTSPSDSPSNVIYKPRLIEAFNFKSTMFSGSKVFGGTSPNLGAVRVANPDGELDNLITGYTFDGRSIRLKLGGEGFTLADFETKYAGKVEKIEWNEQEIRFSIRNPRTALEKVIQPDLYDDTVVFSGAEGRPIPLAYGKMREVEPQFIDNVDLIYQVHERSVEEIQAIYDKGIELTDNGDLSEFSAFASLSDSNLPANPLDGSKIFYHGKNTIIQKNVSDRWRAGSTTTIRQSTNIPVTAFDYVDGNFAYDLDVANDLIKRYTLSSGFDMTTAELDSASLDISSITGTNQASDIRFGESSGGIDGAVLYVAVTTGDDSAPDEVFQYSLSTPWDLGTASLDSASFVMASNSEKIRAIDLSNDGNEMFLLINNTDTLIEESINQYNLSTAWDISTATFSDSFSLSTERDPKDIFLGDSGSKLYVLVEGESINNINSVREYDLSTANDLTTISFSQSKEISGDLSLLSNINFNGDTGTDGDELYISDSNNSTYLHFLTDWDISTLEAASEYFYVGDEDVATSGIFIKDDGKKMFLLGGQNDSVFQYSLSTAWDITTASYDSVSLDVSIETPNVGPRGIDFKDDGSVLFVLGHSTATIYQFTLSTPWDLSTASIDSINFSVLDEAPEPRGLVFGNNGKSLHITDGDKSIYQYELSTAWDLGSASFDNTLFDINSILGDTDVPNSMIFKTDGTRFYIASGSRIHEFSVNTAWDIGSAQHIYSTSDLLSGIIVTLFFRTSGDDGGPLEKGGFFTDEANGKFRLGATPEGTITVDLKGDNVGGYVDTASEIFERIIRVKGGLTNSDIEQSSFDSLATDQPAVHGVYIASRQERMTSVLDTLVESIGGFWTFTRTGKVKIGRLLLPGSTIAGTIDQTDIIKRGVKRKSAGRVVSKIRLGYDKSWTVQSEGALSPLLDSDEKNLRSKEFRYVVSEDSSIDTRHLLAETFEKNTLFDEKTPAQTEADRLLDILGERMDIYRVPIKPRTFEFNLNDNVRLDIPRFGLGGSNFITRVIGISEDVSREMAELTLWVGKKSVNLTTQSSSVGAESDSVSTTIGQNITTSSSSVSAESDNVTVLTTTAYEPQIVDTQGTSTSTRDAGSGGLADGKQLWGSGWFNLQSDDSTNRVIYATGASILDFSIAWIINASDQHQIVMTNASGTQIVDMISNTAFTPASGWHHVCWYVDLGNNAGTIFIDDVEDIQSGPTLTNDTVNASGDSGDNDSILNSSGGGLFLDSYVADLVVDDSLFDISNTTNRRKLITSGLCPVDPGTGGSNIKSGIAYIFREQTVASWPTNDGDAGAFSLDSGSNLVEPSGEVIC